MHYLKLFPETTFQAITHGSFSRQGGRSPAPFASLNTSYAVLDKPENVSYNRRLIKDALGLRRLISARQVHGTQILKITKTPDRDLEEERYDALITNQPGIGLMIQQADCQAVMLFDPVQQIIANIHSGWRGSAANLIGLTISRMQNDFNVEPNTLLAAISPSLGPCCAEFTNFYQELPAHLHKYQNAANHFDFWAISRDQLLQAGLRYENINFAEICTRCNDNYFSFRRNHTTGRMASVIGLRQR